LSDPLQDFIDKGRPYRHGDLRPFIELLEAFMRDELNVKELTHRYQGLYADSDVLWDEPMDRPLLDLWNFLEDIPFDRREDSLEETRKAAQRLLKVLKTYE
jgi:hypothetical protein